VFSPIVLLEKAGDLMRQLVLFTEAREIILAYPVSLDTDEVALMDGLSRVLAEPVVASSNLPPFNRSPLDGFAVCALDTKLASEKEPVSLQVVEEVPAGKVAEKQVVPGAAIKVTTGACLPDGADAVIPYEKTRFNEQAVWISTPVAPNSNISFTGEDVAKGEQVIPANTKITPEIIGMLAALGISKVKVLRKPKIGILSTGDELIGMEGPLIPGKIRNSNLYSLAAMVTQLGCEPVLFGMVGDNLEQTAAKLKLALECDLIISTGGVSVGDYDVVKEAMELAGAKILFWRVDIRPGTPVVCGEKEGKLLLGLSGNPAAALITFELLVKPLILKSFGLPWQMKTVTGRLQGGFAKVTNQLRFLRAKTSWQGNELVTSLSGMQNPGVMKSILSSNSLIMVPAGAGPLQEGDLVDIILTKELEVK
jgi:molybdopterin molybdotransferase